MRQATITHTKNYTLPLRAVKSVSADKNPVRLVNTAWNFACAALWNTIQFSSKEIENAKQQIAALLQSDNAEKAFIAFCERVLLARQYVAKSPGRYIPLPSVWLDSNNKLGFAGTQRWHDNIKAIRESVPGYKTGIKALAEAMLELSKDPSAKNYKYWRSYFIDHNTPGLLQLLQSATVQQLYN